MYGLYNKLLRSAVIKVRKLQWLKYVETINGNENRNNTKRALNISNGEVLKFEKVESFIHLGILINDRCNVVEIKLRTAEGSRCAAGMNKNYFKIDIDIWLKKYCEECFDRK